MSSVMFESLGDKVAMFNQQATRHQDTQAKNPFTSGLNLPRPKFSKEEYGRPAAGSLSDIRGRKASAHIYKEILELCEMIYQNGTPCKDEPDIIGITFGDLFNIYVHINDKCVGLLLRARKQNFLHFEGECLFQRRDDNVPIFLTKPIAEIRQIFKQKLEQQRIEAQQIEAQHL
ncbi:actin-binding Rho-activating protein isoform X1 [Neodiprion pinetum]|uniref:Actin-binding Rho-activating protein isoform X1 n=2 Tax=Neodiprion lecontei TaxID=441921 RepID=A0A6J0BLF2_NEOLC|nr:actin-binding Rho-activating protein isoform X1 [Neodiprion lecontei]XP_046480842.1 actin-binding Rho-activating protein isoform X1 [Neodiprion pinetum]XP_046618211.1 actin-binding Rho-activating protein isoform X1 [Neodiprion virginianus]